MSTAYDQHVAAEKKSMAAFETAALAAYQSIPLDAEDAALLLNLARRNMAKATRVELGEEALAGKTESAQLDNACPHPAPDVPRRSEAHQAEHRFRHLLRAVAPDRGCPAGRDPAVTDATA